MDNEFDVAIVGMACRFPGARNLDEFWKNLVGGVESIVRLSDEELSAAVLRETTRFWIRALGKRRPRRRHVSGS